jgi:hypothetical protein
MANSTTAFGLRPLGKVSGNPATAEMTLSE